MKISTADICDDYTKELQVARVNFNSYGGKKSFFGKIKTIQLDEDNSDLITLLKQDGKNQVAVVDVEAKFVAVVGDKLMAIAKNNSWSAIVINGYVRDIDETIKIEVGLFALGTCPRKSKKKASAEVGGEFSFGDVKFVEGDYLYGDSDGVIVLKEDVLS